MKRKNFLKAIIGLPVIASLCSFKEPVNVEPVVFTPEMLTRNNFGLFIIDTKAGKVTEKNLGYAATVSWKLGFQYNDENKYCKVNFLTDGWLSTIGKTTEEVCNFLNHNQYGIKYRLLTKDEVILMITKRKQGFL